MATLGQTKRVFTCDVALKINHFVGGVDDTLQAINYFDDARLNIEFENMDAFAPPDTNDAVGLAFLFKRLKYAKWSIDVNAKYQADEAASPAIVPFLYAAVNESTIDVSFYLAGSGINYKGTGLITAARVRFDESGAASQSMTVTGRGAPTVAV